MPLENVVCPSARLCVCPSVRVCLHLSVNPMPVTVTVTVIVVRLPVCRFVHVSLRDPMHAKRSYKSCREL